MARTRDGGRSKSSGTAGGTDIEPLRGGMEEQDAAVGSAARRAGRRDDPKAPYHDVTAPAGGLAPRGGAGPQGGATPRDDTPPDPGEGGESGRHVDEKLAEARREVEREGANAPREDPTK